MLPIVQRELLIASRKRTLVGMRVIAALIAFFLLCVGAEFTSATGTAGTRIFRTFTALAYWCCFFGGALLTADCLAVERRNDTLGLLFLTDLKGYDVIFGKLVARSLAGVFCLIAIVPMLAIPLLLGGVAPDELWRSVLVLLNTLFLSLSVGMLVSVFSKQRRGVAAVSVFIMVLIAFAFPAVLSLANRSVGYNELLWILFPPMALELRQTARYAGSEPIFWMNLAVTHAFSWCLLGVACFWVTRSWHTRPQQGAWLVWQQFRRRIVHGGADYRARLRMRLLDINPLLWLTSRDRSLRVFLSAFFVALTVACYWMNCSRWFHWSYLVSPMSCFVFLHVLFLLLVAFEAASYLIERRRDDALELILSTGLTTNEILHGHWLAARRLFNGALFAMIVYAVAWGITAHHYARPGNRALAIVFPILMLANLLVSGRSMVWCAMSYSFRARWHSGPALLAFGAIVLLPFCWMGLLCFPVLGTSGVHNPLVVWIVITAGSTLNAWVFGTWARNNLEENFRQKMTEPRLRKAAPVEG